MLEDKDSDFKQHQNLLDQEHIRFRYGIVGINDLTRDLRYWETLAVSSMMQRPIKTLIEGDPSLEL